ncbi:Forkhead box protein N4 [Xenotaenia resolanae]|uniref:Forkhead box protein N4 n=1 Tax=Xenotaenia resolanae TaxID=208358 RepID=A0ABV0WE57_9TELE
MIEGGITSRMSGIVDNAGHHPSPQDYRLLTTDPSQLRVEDLPGDLQSLSWLTSVDVPRLQQMADSRGHSNGPSQGSLLEQQTGRTRWSCMKLMERKTKFNRGQSWRETC